MGLSLIILIDGGIIIVVGLLFCFFGYKLSRLLFPLPAIILIESLVYIYLYDALSLDALGTWLFFGGTSVVLYVAFFLIPRIAGFFTGMAGSALLLLFVVKAAGLYGMPYLYPACLTICVVSGLLAVVYRKNAVIVFSAVLGACVSVFAGFYIYTAGVGAAGLFGTENVLVSLEGFLNPNAVLLAGASAAAAAAGILIQLLVTSDAKVLPEKTGGENTKPGGDDFVS